MNTQKYSYSNNSIPNNPNSKIMKNYSIIQLDDANSYYKTLSPKTQYLFNNKFQASETNEEPLKPTHSLNESRASSCKKSVGSYLDRRHRETQEKMNRIRNEMYNTENQNMTFKPKISDNSQKIVEKLIECDKYITNIKDEKEKANTEIATTTQSIKPNYDFDEIISDNTEYYKTYYSCINKINNGLNLGNHGSQGVSTEDSMLQGQERDLQQQGIPPYSNNSQTQSYKQSQNKEALETQNQVQGKSITQFHGIGVVQQTLPTQNSNFRSGKINTTSKIIGNQNQKTALQKNSSIPLFSNQSKKQGPIKIKTSKPPLSINSNSNSIQSNFNLINKKNQTNPNKSQFKPNSNNQQNVNNSFSHSNNYNNSNNNNYESNISLINNSMFSQNLSWKDTAQEDLMRVVKSRYDMINQRASSLKPKPRENNHLLTYQHHNHTHHIPEVNEKKNKLIKKDERSGQNNSYSLQKSKLNQINNSFSGRAGYSALNTEKGLTQLTQVPYYKVVQNNLYYGKENENSNINIFRQKPVENIVQIRNKLSNFYYNEKEKEKRNHLIGQASLTVPNNKQEEESYNFPLLNQEMDYNIKHINLNDKVLNNQNNISENFSKEKENKQNLKNNTFIPQKSEYTELIPYTNQTTNSNPLIIKTIREVHPEKKEAEKHNQLNLNKRVNDLYHLKNFVNCIGGEKNKVDVGKIKKEILIEDNEEKPGNKLNDNSNSKFNYNYSVSDTKTSSCTKSNRNKKSLGEKEDFNAGEFTFSNMNNNQNQLVPNQKEAKSFNRGEQESAISSEYSTNKTKEQLVNNASLTNQLKLDSNSKEYLMMKLNQMKNMTKNI